MIEAADGAAPFGAAAGEEDRVMAQSLVPVIDIELFLSGGAEAKARVAAEVDDACRNIGFLVIAGHGVAEAQTEAVRRVTRAFFDLPHWDKLRVKMPPDRYRGFMAVGSEDVAYSMDEHQNAPDSNASSAARPITPMMNIITGRTAGVSSRPICGPTWSAPLRVDKIRLRF